LYSLLLFEYDILHIDNQWGNIEVKTDPYLRLHIGATSLHYGQACFEGMKAFHNKDGDVKIFRPDENAKRIEQSCSRLMNASTTTLYSFH
jgi:branched-chain amino acid aminotransferase